MDDTTIQEKFLVTQSNSLIEAKHTENMTTNELKIVLSMISKIQPNDEDFKEYTISYKEFSKLIGLTDYRNHTHIRKVVKRIMTHVIEIKQNDGTTLLTHWATSAKMVEGEGLIKLKFDPDLKPHLINLGTLFTRYQLSNVLSLDSSFSIRLYEILKMNEFKTTFVIDVENLKNQLGATKPTYKVYSQFKRAVLDKSLEENNRKTDINTSYKEIKVGRKVVSIQFTVKGKKQNVITKSLPTQNQGDNKEQDNEPKKNGSVKMTDVEYEFFHFLVVLEEQNIDLKIREDILYSMFMNGLQIWNNNYDRTIRELVTLLTYAYHEESINNPIGFVLSEVKKSLLQKESSSGIGELGVVDEEMLPTYLTSNYAIDSVPLIFYYPQIEEKINKRFNQYKITNNSSSNSSLKSEDKKDASNKDVNTLLAEYEEEMRELILGEKLLTEEGKKRYKELEKLVDEINNNEKSPSI